MLSLETFEQLQTPQGEAALAAAQSLAPTDTTLLSSLVQLRKLFAPELAAAALETAMLRHRARTKFSCADSMFFTREALEQASGELVARYRASRYRGVAEPVYDVCCSIGGDTVGLALAGMTVVGSDLDPLRLAMAEANVAAYGVRHAVTLRVADARALQPPDGAMLFFDPARRRTGRTGSRRRVFQPNDYEPPLSLVEQWLGHAAGFGVKVAPGIDYDALPYSCEIDIVSVNGEVKEACLWFGSLQRHARTATVIDGQGEVQVLHLVDVPPVGVMPPRRYLYEPDGAVIRAHLVEQLANLIHGAKIDDQIAFITSDILTNTPFARAFEVQEVLPFNLKRLRSRLRELAIGRVVVKKRGSPIDPQVLERQLRLSPAQPNTTTLILTHVLGQPSVVLCTPVEGLRH